MRTKPPTFPFSVFAGNGSLEDILAADDPDSMIVDLDRVDD
ncbi:hypothetical protein [Rhodopseudomonas pseudopalustris]|nr:hypothetical protein [Rhodopseudomonas pseudopalustris]